MLSLRRTSLHDVPSLMLSRSSERLSARPETDATCSPAFAVLGHAVLMVAHCGASAPSQPVESPQVLGLSGRTTFHHTASPRSGYPSMRKAGHGTGIGGLLFLSTRPTNGGSMACGHANGAYCRRPRYLAWRGVHAAWQAIVPSQCREEIRGWVCSVQT